MVDELEKLRAENNELRALVAEQFEGLAALRREFDAYRATVRKKHAEILDLVAKRDWLYTAIKEQAAENLGLFTPTKN